MGIVIAGMSMSLDGFVADPDGTLDLLYPDFADLQGSEFMSAIIEETGAVLMGRKTFEMGDPDSYVGSYEFQVPIFVLTHHPPRTAPKQDERLTFTFVSGDVAAAVAQAKSAAGEKAVQVVGGANVIRQMLRAGLVDELHIDIMPVLLGAGLRLFDPTDDAPTRLERTTMDAIGQRTSLRFRVIR
jgi:dihydrofolate reductase